MNVTKLTWDDIYHELANIKYQIMEDDIVFGIPRGGLVVAGLIKAMYRNIKITEDPKEATVIIDDIVDSGTTKQKYLRINPTAKFLAIVDKQQNPSEDWIIFPWEHLDTSKDIEDALLRVMQSLNLDVNKTTPTQFFENLKNYIKE
jgi:hypoxanthine phosphoribosyltransferase